MSGQKKFIADFQHHLDEKERTSIVNFNLSRVYFEKMITTERRICS
jgi:hypothetical protein